VIVVDTNILIYAADRQSPLHKRCRQLLLELRTQPTAFYLTWGIIYEFLRVVTHPRVFRKPWNAHDAWRFLQALLSAPGAGVLVETAGHEAFLMETLKAVPDLSGNLLHDGHTAALMREHGIKRIVTRDTDFHRFPFIEVVDPVNPG